MSTKYNSYGKPLRIKRIRTFLEQLFGSKQNKLL